MIHCLPGFLGRGADFSPFEARLSATGVGGVVLHDLFSGPPLGGSLEEWGRNFADGVPADSAAALLGYSLGGRLALHALLARPDLWRIAVVVSAHTGLSSAQECHDRLTDDRAWADRFRSDPWEQVLARWNARPVFGERTPPERAKQEFAREALVAGLTDWSLGAQEDLLPRLEEIRCPVLWVVGESDARFREIGARAVDRLPRGRLAVIPNAAHRVHVDAPDRFAEVVVDFLQEGVGGC